MRARLAALPRWVYFALLLGLAAVVLQQYSTWTTPAAVRRAAQGLDGSSAYADPSAPGVIDLARARQVIGDRPILVAVLPPNTGSRIYKLCEQVVQRHPGNVALVYQGSKSSAICKGDDFPKPTTATDADQWLEVLIITTDYSSSLRTSSDTTDHTPDVEEFVLAFDAAVNKDYADGIPRRSTSASTAVWWQVVTELLGLVLGVVLAVGVLRLLAVRTLTVLGQRRTRRLHALEQQARLSRVADTVLEPVARTKGKRAEELATAAGRYVGALTAFEAARTEDDRAAVDVQLSELERTLQLPTSHTRTAVARP